MLGEKRYSVLIPTPKCSQPAPASAIRYGLFPVVELDQIQRAASLASTGPKNPSWIDEVYR
ncbi:MAG: hypothetical protein RL173_2465, partial [Fibrobacterota bacterium]